MRGGDALRVRHRRVDAARVDGVDADAVRAELERRDLGHAAHRELRADIGGERVGAREPVSRGVVDDRPLALLHHLRRHGAHAVEGADHVDLEDAAQVGGAGREQVLEHQDAGVVHQHVEAAVSAHHRRDDLLPARLVGDIVAEGRGARPERRRGGLDLGEDVGERDDGALLDEPLGDRRAHAARRARDDGDLAVQPAHANLPGLDRSGRRRDASAPAVGVRQPLAALARAMLMATSSIMSSCPPTVFMRPISMRMSSEGTPYLAAARLANSRNDEYTPA